MKTQNQNKKKPNTRQKKEKFQPKSFKRTIFGNEKIVSSFVYEIVQDLIYKFGVSELVDDPNMSSLDALASDMYTCFASRLPELKANGQNSYWSLTYASNRIALKSENGYQFGCIIKYNKDRSDYESVEFFYTAYAAKALPETEDYVESGWELAE